jgi:hypothetical protein
LYRAASGALVFGAGTVQWAWGIDADHDGSTAAADSRMQQATMNMLADMKSLPTTLMAGLVAPTASADSQAPTSVITSPAAGSAKANGVQVTVTGTASDAGGQVAGVEVSLDGGTSWHPASGTTSWTYNGVLHGSGTGSIRSRATDDSANIQTPVATAAVTTSCPCTLFGAAVPAVADSNDGSSVEAGVRFTSDTAGFVTGVRFYKASANTGSHTGTLWSAGGTQLASGTFTGETASGWQTLQFATSVAIAANTTYVASYFAPNGHYSSESDFFYYRDYVAAPLRAPSLSSSDSSKLNGVYGNGHAFPSSSYQATNYFVDVVLGTQAATGPAVTAQTPAAGATNVAVTAAPTATFSKAINSATLAFGLKNASNTAVAGASSYNATSLTATFTPTSALASGATYTATVSGSDASGNASPPATWSFTTAGTATCPCTLFANAAPAVADSDDGNAVNLGVKFTPSAAGSITGVRFYKSAANTGSHTGALWSAAGAQLATGTFAGETASGWQTLTFASPVAVTANTTYVASYFAPNGHYADGSGFFATTYTSGPLSAPAGANGVYLYGPSGFPNSSYNSTNYWVDPVFSTTATPPGDTTPPTVTSTSPASGASGVAVSVKPSAVFSEAATSIVFAVKNAANTAVAGTSAYVAASRTVTFTPTSALAAGATYTASVSASDASGNAMAAPATWAFTTAGTATCPCTLFAATAVPATVDAADSSAVNLGVKFTPSVAGWITGVRFYKSAANTGSHVGKLWSAAGAQLATGTFAGETASGWQTLTFVSPVAVAANTTYVASYYAPNGSYSANGNFFAAAYTNGPLSAPAGANGVYLYGASGFPNSSYNSTNYWVDPLFATP